MELILIIVVLLLLFAAAADTGVAGEVFGDPNAFLRSGERGTPSLRLPKRTTPLTQLTRTQRLLERALDENCTAHTDLRHRRESGVGQAISRLPKFGSGSPQ